MSLITGGTDSTAETLTAAVYYFLTERECQKKVMEELDAAPRDANGRLTLTVIQQLPYLVGILPSMSILALTCH
jgi:cytochrome P450